MNITAKEAYKIAKKTADGFQIYTCRELHDCWLFGWCMKDGSAIHLPPIKVSKFNGDVSLHDECGVSFLNGTCKEEGKEVPIDSLID